MMPISEVQREIAKDQAKILRKLTSARIKAANLQTRLDAELAVIDMLTEQLNDAAPEAAAWWDEADPAPVVELSTFGQSVPLPTAIAERVVYTSRGRFSSVDGFTSISFGVDE